MIKVCIDPGHGGKDPGAVGNGGLTEASVNLTLARMLEQKVSEYAEPLLTRKSNEYVSLQDRVELANQEKASFFISLHCNSVSNPNARGTETIYWPSSVEGRKLAEKIHPHLVSATGFKDRGIKPDQRGLYVLKHTKMPALIVEVGFISNPSEEAWMRNQEWLDDIAEAVSSGICEYLEEKGLIR